MGTLQDLARLAFSLAQRALAGDLEIPGQGQGDLLEYDGIAWSPLPPGAVGEVLTSNGPGADPSYQAPAGGLPGTWSRPIDATVVVAENVRLAAAAFFVSQTVRILPLPPLLVNDGFGPLQCFSGDTTLAPGFGVCEWEFEEQGAAPPGQRRIIYYLRHRNAGSNPRAFTYSVYTVEP